MDIRSTLIELCEACNSHDLDRIMAFFTMIASWKCHGEASPGARFEGKHNVREALAMRFQGLPDVHNGTAEDFVDAAADTGISKWTLTGTSHDGTRTEVYG